MPAHLLAVVIVVGVVVAHLSIASTSAVVVAAVHDWWRVIGLLLLLVAGHFGHGWMLLVALDHRCIEVVVARHWMLALLLLHDGMLLLLD